jgi:hypothetical protein
MTIVRKMRALLVLLALVLTGTCLPAQNFAVPRGSALTITTSANRVVLPGNQPKEISVSIQFRNRSREALHFEFDSLESAAARFEFSLYAPDSDEPIFSTLGTPARRQKSPAQTNQSLPALGAWTATASIPTILSGTPLAPGSYRIEAVLLADPSVAAATFFQVHTDREPPLPPIVDESGKINRVPVSEINSLSATLVTKPDASKVVQVEATGTVPHPGFTRNPRLVIPQVVPAITMLHGNILFLRFEVDPPDPKLMYPMVLSSVNVSAEFPHTNQVMVWVYAAKSHQTAEILVPRD